MFVVTLVAFSSVVYKLIQVRNFMFAGFFRRCWIKSGTTKHLIRRPELDSGPQESDSDIGSSPA